MDNVTSKIEKNISILEKLKTDQSSYSNINYKTSEEMRIKEYDFMNDLLSNSIYGKDYVKVSVKALESDESFSNALNNAFKDGTFSFKVARINSYADLEKISSITFDPKPIEDIKNKSISKLEKLIPKLNEMKSVLETATDNASFPSFKYRDQTKEFSVRIFITEPVNEITKIINLITNVVAGHVGFISDAITQEKRLIEDAIKIRNSIKKEVIEDANKLNK
jgi:hypothetical protein